MKENLVKLIMVYDTGAIRFLEGEDVKKWEKASIGAAVNLSMRGSGKTGFEDINWQRLSKPLTLEPK